MYLLVCWFKVAAQKQNAMKLRHELSQNECENESLLYIYGHLDDNVATRFEATFPMFGKI